MTMLSNSAFEKHLLDATFDAEFENLETPEDRIKFCKKYLAAYDKKNPEKNYRRIIREIVKFYTEELEAAGVSSSIIRQPAYDANGNFLRDADGNLVWNYGNQIPSVKETIENLGPLLGGAVSNGCITSPGAGYSSLPWTSCPSLKDIEVELDVKEQTFLSSPDLDANATKELIYKLMLEIASKQLYTLEKIKYPHEQKTTYKMSMKVLDKN